MQVKYKELELVVKCTICSVFNANTNTNSLSVLVVVEKLWQELLQEHLENHSKKKMKVFFSLSHELRTPLSCSISMVNFIEKELLAKKDPALDLLVKKYLKPTEFSNKILLN
jgi:hypothetical protein